MAEINLFEVDSRENFMFKTAKGVVTSSDLWVLPLTQLNDLAKDLNKQIKESSEEDFISTKTKESTVLSQKFEIVLHIIRTRQAEAQAKTEAKAVEERKRVLREALHEKKNAELLSMSAAEIEAELSKLG